jgi:hypothetical protein
MGQLGQTRAHRQRAGAGVRVRIAYAFPVPSISACPHEGAQLVEQFRLARKAGLGLHHIRGDQPVRSI